jgi:hypothetical protein
MANRNARQRPDFTARLQKAHEEIHAAFRDAMKETRCSQSQAAMSMGVNVDTVRNWVRKRSRVRVANVFVSRRLGPTFKRLMCSEHHDFSYVAKKKRRGTK